ncbi:MAG: hypothetical protein HKL86_02900 [Acidimicrobiaceae bacterium]|nr:hypothetical protein [Acidimicrobiaceae bacterium]
MATKQRSRTRRTGSSRDRGAPYVAPVLDPTWTSPYAPSSNERNVNARAVRSFAMRRKLPTTIAVAVVSLLLVVGFVLVAWLPIVGVVIAALYGWDLHRSLRRYESRGSTLGAELVEKFQVGGSAKDRLRLVTVLDRLAATFGVDSISAFIVEDPMYNAALVPDSAEYSLLVTSSLMRDFELIELEGVVAHCLARQRLGLLSRQSLSCVLNLSDSNRRELASPGSAYRADEVAAAAIRYPLGIAGALRKCAHQSPVANSFFSSAPMATYRFCWFNFWSDRRESDLADLDDPKLRALALEEW